MVAIFLALYFTVFKTKDNTVQAPSPFPGPVAVTGSFTGSGGTCTHDTDCPVTIRVERDPISGVNKSITYTQYCTSGACSTSKPCTTNSNCIPDNVTPEMSSCDPLSGQPCNYTAGCVNGFCQRLRCQNNVNCGLFEACTMNVLDGGEYGYCMPLGNTCNNTQKFGTTSTGNGSVECWGGYFPCTGFNGSIGYCTQCYAGSEAGGACNMTNNINTGPGSVCTTVQNFPINNSIPGAAPASCTVADGVNHTACANGHSSVPASTTNVCCKASASSMCGKTCQDDYQCDNSCPFCVNGQCNCVQMSPFSLWRDKLTSTYSCIDGYGFSGDSITGNVNINEIIDDIHVCVVSNAFSSTHAYNYNPFGINGNLNCPISTPYYNIASGTCVNSIQGAACNYDAGSNSGFCTNSDGSINTDYYCDITSTCQPGMPKAGEKCSPATNPSCDTGLICVAVSRLYKCIQEYLYS